MKFHVDKAIQILERTPRILTAMLSGMPDEWTSANEGDETWSAYHVVGHLIHGERTDWIPRTEIILSGGVERKFPAFDMFAQFTDSKDKSLQQLLNEFAALRAENIAKLRARRLTESDLETTGIHPEFGEVTLRQHLATWVAHDLDHVSQIARVMAKQYREEVGPWVKYLKILR